MKKVSCKPQSQNKKTIPKVPTFFRRFFSSIPKYPEIHQVLKWSMPLRSRKWIVRKNIKQNAYFWWTVHPAPLYVAFWVFFSTSIYFGVGGFVAIWGIFSSFPAMQQIQSSRQKRWDGFSFWRLLTSTSSSNPKGTMYGIFTYTYHENKRNVGKIYHGSYGTMIYSLQNTQN